MMARLVLPLLACALPAAAQVLKDFDDHVKDYVKLHKTARSEVHGLKPTPSSEAIEHHEHQLAHQIREMREGAAQGNIFAPPIAAEFRRLIAITMASQEGGRIRESLKRAAPVRLNAMRVNQNYPAGVPLQSTPPSILGNLPALPPELEYRLVGRALVLRDAEANLIVDFIPDAIQ